VYDFRQLSPADVEELARDLLQEEWKIRLEAFKTGRDQGIDLRYAALPSQATIVQSKHYVGSTVAKLVRDLRVKEMPKVVRVNPKRYVLVTTLCLSPADKDKILAVLGPYTTTPHDVLGAEDLNNLLGRHSRIEEQHFKLWMSSTQVLQHVLYNATHVQTEFDVKRVLRNIPLYVQTGNYAKALSILDKHRVVIISGMPGIGKTTLADMLLFAHLEAGYQPIVVRADIKEAKDLFRSGKKQVFYFDDFLGQTFLGQRFEFLGKREDAIILDFIETVARSKHARFILTTREHILRHAFEISEHFRRRRSDLTEQHFILELDNYTLLDRARILYNHIYFSDLAKPYKTALLRDEFYLRILKHRNFNPRLIEWLSRYTNIKRIPARRYQYEVERVLENPEELWRMAFEQQISDAARSVLLALYTLGGEAEITALQQAWRPLHQHRAQKYQFQRQPHEWRQALHELEGGFLEYDDGTATFINPSVKDFLNTTLATDFDHLDDLLASARQFSQVLTIWALAVSDKGTPLQEYFRREPRRLLGAATQHLGKPYEPAATSLDVRDTVPEVRLLTILSIANYTKSEALFATTTTYANAIVGRWSGNVPNTRAATHVLRALDNATWPKLKHSNIHAAIKAALLQELTDRSDTADLTAVTEYAENRDARWNDEDKQKLIIAVEQYLQDGFDTEFSDASDEQELDRLETRLETIGEYCDTSVAFECGLIQDRIAEMKQQSNDEDQPVHEWQSKEQDDSPSTQEAEVRRLFDGLIDVPQRKATPANPSQGEDD
jgi:hypothetical protein